MTAVFDEEPKSFPVGFSHDVSLVDISGISDVPRTIPYATDLTWLTQQEWMDIKYNSSNLVLLDDRSREAKSIGLVDSRCQVRDVALSSLLLSLEQSSRCPRYYRLMGQVNIPSTSSCADIKHISDGGTGHLPHPAAVPQTLLILGLALSRLEFISPTRSSR